MMMTSEQIARRRPERRHGSDRLAREVEEWKEKREYTLGKYHGMVEQCVIAEREVEELKAQLEKLKPKPRVYEDVEPWVGKRDPDDFVQFLARREEAES